MSLRHAQKLLEMLTEQFPPPAGCKHALVTHEKGQLLVVLMREDPITSATVFRHIAIDEGDLDRDVLDLFVDIVDMLKAADFDRDAHLTHGRITPEDTPNLSHCPCHYPGNEVTMEICARNGCGYCALTLKKN